jgi:acyl carrier protein
MTEVEIRDSIKKVIANVSDIDPEAIGDSASFKEDLGLDSLILLEISVDIGLRFQLDIAEEQLMQLQTVQDAVELVQQCLVAKV